MIVHCGASWRRGNSGEEVRHEVGSGVRVVEEVHDDGWDLVKVAAVLEVGQRGRSTWRRMRAEGNRCRQIGLVVTATGRRVGDARYAERVLVGVTTGRDGGGCRR
jgi:hypothetical protein